MKLEPHLRPGDGVLDIGANNGEYARGYAACVGPTGFVLAVEPREDIAQRARERSAPWPWISVVCAAVGYPARDAVLHVDRHPKRGSLWAENCGHPAGQTQPTRVVTLDELASQFQNLRAIKIDAQGAEGEILQGATEALQNRALTWRVEIWPVGLEQAGSSAQTVMETFMNAGWMPVDASWATVQGWCEDCATAPESACDVVLQHSARVDTCRP